MAAPGIDSVEPGARIFVWGVWAALLLFDLGLIVRFGPDLPVGDDFDVVAVVTRARPATLQWLWSQHNEHRVPLPRLILLGLYRLSGYDFRAGMFWSVATLAALAGATLAVADRRRGARSSDAVFPLLLLGPGNYANLLWSWQVQFVFGTVLIGSVLLLIVAHSGWPEPGRAALAGAALAALPLCGANGLIAVPALALWLLAASAAHARSGRPDGQRTAVLVLAATLPAVLLAGLYVAGYHRAEHHPGAPGVAEALRTSLQFLSLVFGPSARVFWPASGILALALTAGSALLVARAALVGPAPERPRALGLACVFAAFGTLVLTIGWGRSGSGERAGFEVRYVTLVAPLGCALVFAWHLYATPVLRRLEPSCIFAATLVLLWPNTQEALDHARTLNRQASEFTRAVREGVPMHMLIRRFPFLHPSHDELTTELPALRQARIGVFAELRDNGMLREVAVPLAPAGVRMGRWENGTVYINGVDPLIHFILPEAIRVAGIRIAYTHANRAGGPARFVFLWSSRSHQRPNADQRYANWALPTGRNRTTTIWLGDTVKEFWIQPDNQLCEFTIVKLDLLVPEP
jgi:hypothetical protein